MKLCTKCGEAKALELFSKAGNPCRSCRARLESERRAALGAQLNDERRAAHQANPEKRIWRDMIRRCTDPRRDDYQHYGARGITVDPRWLESFDAFLADMGRRPSPKHSIDRINNDKGYEPGNCRWATQKEQLTHFSRTRLITAHGRTQTLAQWSEELGAPPRLIHQRLDYLGWSPERAVSERPKGVA